MSNCGRLKKIENPSLKADLQSFFVDIKTELGGIQYDYSENGDLRWGTQD